MRNKATEELRRELPPKYASKLERIYSENKDPKERWSKSTILKVAAGTRINIKILNDLYLLAEEYQEFLYRLRLRERRMKKANKA
jgi:hypothetical protein